MPFLTVAGETLRCVRNEWRRVDDEVQGEMVRMMDGTMGSTMRNAKRVYEGSVVWLTTAEADTFRANVSVGGSPGVPAAVAATSDADGLLGGDALTVYAILGGGEAVYYSDGGEPTIYWRFFLRLVEA